MEKLSFENFIKLLEGQMNQTRWIIYFKDDNLKRKYEIGTFKMLIKPYWIKDRHNNRKYDYELEQGTYKLVSDKVFNGKSLKERWNEAVFIEKIDE